MIKDYCYTFLAGLGGCILALFIWFQIVGPAWYYLRVLWAIEKGLKAQGFVLP